MTMATILASRLARAALLASAALVSGSTIPAHQQVAPGEIPLVTGPPVRTNLTPMEGVLACFADHVASTGKPPIVVSVGDVKDYTGKYSINEGNAITQGNALNYTAGADYGSPAAPLPAGTSLAIGGAPDMSVAGRAAVTNLQDNSGAVSANSTDATYFVALNTAGGPAITNGTVGVIGNNVSAAAYGNTASNSLALNSVNTGMPTAVIANYQTNSGPVTASVTTVSYGVNSGLGAITGGALAVTGNSVTATAIGNNSVSTIGTVR